MSNSTVPQLPPSLNLPPHLSAHKYFFVCTLTVAAWDTLVLVPRSWRLWKTEGWPVLKILFNFLKFLMPIEFTIVGVAFFDTRWSQHTCSKFYLFEPICTAFLLAAASAVHVIRVHAIYQKSRAVLIGLCSLFAVQVVVTAICCGFYESVPLEDGQGCIAGPKHNWVGIYWLSISIFYTATFGLALARSLKSLEKKPLTYWKLMLRDGLNLYGAIWLVNMVNMLFWFIIKPTGENDSVKTTVTSMAAVLTTSMTLRIILSVRGSLNQGGSFAGGSAHSGNSRSTNVISTSRSQVGPGAPQTFDLSRVSKVAEGGEWHLGPAEGDGKSSVNESDRTGAILPVGTHPEAPGGVKITIDREIEYDDAYPRAK